VWWNYFIRINQHLAMTKKHLPEERQKYFVKEKGGLVMK
jgi:hypothetical protein